MAGRPAAHGTIGKQLTSILVPLARDEAVEEEIVALERDGGGAGSGLPETADSAHARGHGPSEVVLREARLLQEVSEQSGLRRPVRMDGDREAHDSARLPVDVVATVGAQQLSAVPLQG